jgi:hypothetical protein
VEARPAWLPLRAKARITFAADAKDARLGVHRWDRDRRTWVFWGADLRGDGRVGTTTDRLGPFALLADESPPRVVATERRRLQGLPWRDDGEEAVIRYEELGQGLARDAGRLELDGRGGTLVGEHDPDRSEIAFALPPDLAGRPVLGTLTLVDRAGLLTREPLVLPP